MRAPRRARSHQPSSFATGGQGIDGTIDPLQSQYALALSHDDRFLCAVNAGSTDISAFRVREDGSLRLIDRVASGGQRPIGLATADELLYVLNNGGETNNNIGMGNITGFRFDADGKLAPIAGSTRALRGASVGGSTSAFSRDGRFLAVTERVANSIALYRVDDGLATGPFTTASAGQVPFGFAFGREDVLVVSEAATQTASSYRATKTGAITTISARLPTQGAAPCWLTVAPNGR
jgi:6-phosphogluconolactonase (cycloisomerase 2 family)